MRQRHFAGEKLFVDYAGRTVPIYGAGGEEAFRAHLFVGAMGASGYAYAEATRSESLPDWLGSHVRMLEFYGAAPTIIVPDNPKVGVTQRGSLRAGAAALVRGDGCALPLRGDPGAAVPPEGQKPGGVVGFTGLSLAPRAPAAPALLQPRGTQRRDPPAARQTQRSALPATAGLTAQRVRCARPAGDAGIAADAVRVRRVERAAAAFDYHVDVDRHYYSVPHALVGHSVWARFTAATVEVFFRSERVASHVRSYQRGAHTTLREHMPKSHLAHAEWSPKRLIHWGSSIGIHTGAVVEHLLRSKPHPEQGYRACLGLLNLSREYGEGRLEAASALAVRLGSPTRKSVKSILESGRDLRKSEALETRTTGPRECARPRLLPLTTNPRREHVDEPNDRNTEELKAPRHDPCA